MSPKGFPPVAINATAHQGPVASWTRTHYEFSVSLAHSPMNRSNSFLAFQA
jgi:hypothetical protein